MTHIVTIDASQKQLSKLRNGHPVRIKKGTGFNVIVHPQNYHLTSRAFAKNKGIEIRLSPEEIEMNKGVSPEQHVNLKEANPEIAGEGIFGKKFDRMLHKAGVKKAVYRMAEKFKPLAKAGIVSGLTAGATALGSVQPELIPFLPAGVIGLSGLATDYIDNPDKYLQGKSGIKGPNIKNFAGQVIQSKLDEKLNDELGRNYGYMGRAGIENALAQSASAELNKGSISQRYSAPPDFSNMGMLGGGLYAGRGIKTHDRSIMGRGNVSNSGYVPPALISQPLSANFQFRHFMPVQYQQFTGSGLFA